MKLNLGCRNRPIPGFTGMDCDAHDGVDIVGDISDLSQFESDAVEEIYASHVLEHFPHTQTLAVLAEWCRVLKKGGKLYLAVPDFDATMDIARSSGLSEWVRNYLWGDQKYKTAFHYAGFDEIGLSTMLKDVGFTEIERAERLAMTATPDCSDLAIRAKTASGKEKIISVSLNLIGTK